MSSDDNKNCWFVLNTSKPVVVSIASNNSEGNVEAEDISIGSLADTVSAVSEKKSGFAIEPGRLNIPLPPA